MSHYGMPLVNTWTHIHTLRRQYQFLETRYVLACGRRMPGLTSDATVTHDIKLYDHVYVPTWYCCADYFLCILGCSSTQKATTFGINECQDSNCFKTKFSWQLYWWISEVLYSWSGLQKGTYVSTYTVYVHLCMCLCVFVCVCLCVCVLRACVCNCRKYHC